MRLDPVNKIGQLRARYAQSPLERFRDESERGFEQVRDAARRSGLRMASHGVTRRDAEFALGKSGEEFRQPVMLEMHGRANDAR